MTGAAATHRILVTVLTYNEGEKLRSLVNSFDPDRSFDLLFIDDGSTDASADFLRDEGYTVIRHEANVGVGAGIREALAYCSANAYEIIVIMAGNGKMRPEEIERLIEPITSGRADYVQGSRYLEGGASPNLPFLRGLAIRAFTLTASVLLRRRQTDVTCGFRAYRVSLTDDPGIDLAQDWLGRYEMEYYLHYKAVRLGYRVAEVPVSMVYPESGRDYSKIRPFVGWWSIIRPWIFLTLGIKK